MIFCPTCEEPGRFMYGLACGGDPHELKPTHTPRGLASFWREIWACANGHVWAADKLIDREVRAVG